MGKRAAAQNDETFLGVLWDLLCGRLSPLLTVGFIILLILGVWVLARFFGEVPPTRIDAKNVALTPDPPVWIKSSDISGEVFATPELGEPLFFTSENLTEQLANRFESHPWVRDVEKVQLHPPTNVTIKVEYRKPVLLGETEASILTPISTGCFRLPYKDFAEPAERRKYLRLLKVPRPTLPAVGQHWNDPYVLGAVRLANALRERYKVWNITTIGAATPRSPQTEHLPHYQITTKNGTVIVWGLPPIDPNAPNAEKLRQLAVLSTKEKIACLDAYLKANGSLDHNQLRFDVVEIEVTPVE